MLIISRVGDQSHIHGESLTLAFPQPLIFKVKIEKELLVY